MNSPKNRRRYTDEFKRESVQLARKREGKITEAAEQAIQRIFKYIEVFYNRQRIHSSLGDKVPVEFIE